MDNRKINLQKSHQDQAAEFHKVYGDPRTRTEKICGHCKTKLPLEAFHRNRTKLDGRSGYCKDCNKKYCSGSL